MTETNVQGSPAATPVVDGLLGKEIDGCAIVKKIGQGGMGIVYLAEHTKLRQQYVVKILNPALTAAEDTVQRFFREAQSVARLNHPAIVSIQNVGQEGEYYYIRMEYVDGDTVENIVKTEKKLEWKLATKIVLDTADALSHAHKKGIIHRDIKPENIMFTTNGQVKVMDFGLAKQVQAATKVSITGQIVGTPFFMSPEQAGGKTTDARSDIYSLGVTYYYLLTGMKPFNGKNLQEIFLKHFFYTPESPKIYTPQLPEEVCDVIRRCLKKKKKERYQSAAELAKDLRVVLGLEAAPSDGASASSPDMAPAYREEEDGPNRSKLDFAMGSKTAVGPGAGPGGASSVLPRSSGVMAPSDVPPDLAAAQAELGGGGNTVQVGDLDSMEVEGSKTVAAMPAAPAPTGDEPAAPVMRRAGRVALDGGKGPAPSAPPADAQPGGPPLQRREGRVGVEEAASASLVFKPKAGPLDAPAAAAPAAPAAPLQRREGRVALEEAASASLVFQKSPAAPAPQGEAVLQRREGRVELETAASASLVFQGGGPLGAPAQPEADGPATGEATLVDDDDDMPSAPTSPEDIALVKTFSAARRAPPSVNLRLAGLAGVAAFLLFGCVGYELAGRSSYHALEKRYAELQKQESPTSDPNAWGQRANEYLQLSRDFEAFTHTFSLGMKVSDARDFSLKCLAAADSAEKARTTAKVQQGAGGFGLNDAAARERENDAREFKSALDEIARLEQSRNLRVAGEKAVAAFQTLAKKLGSAAQAKVMVPLEVSSDPGGAKVYLADGGTLLGETPQNGGSLVIHAHPFEALKLEIKRPRFKPTRWEKTVSGYARVECSLEREVRRRFSAGSIAPRPLFKDPRWTETVRVDAPFVLDPQASSLSFVGRDGTLRSLDMRSGRSSWLQQILIGEYGDPLPGPDVLSGRAIVTASAEGAVRAHDAQTGAVVWSVNLGAPIIAGPRFSADGLYVLAGTSNGDIALLDANNDGRVLWSASADAAIATRPQIRGTSAFVASLDGKLRTFDVASGKLRSTYDAQAAITAGPILFGETLYVGTRDGRVLALPVSAPTTPTFATASAGSPIVDLAATAEAVYYMTANELRAVSSTAGGNQIFPPYAPGMPLAGFALNGERIVLVTQTGVVTSVDARTGEVAWWFPLVNTKGEAFSVAAPPVVNDDEIYVFTREGEVIVVAGD